ncbi:MAG TPA: ArgE/DapE family deacylase [Candidatus Nitrosotenuis sp.]|nr:ArgE/DapE family deacylase [Candidatus Nitrosotenuis sp.]
MSVNPKETIALLRALVGIESVNPTLVAGARGEAEIARFVQRWLRKRGIAAELQETHTEKVLNEKKAAAKGAAKMLSRPNVLATIGPAKQESAARHGAKFGKGRVGIANSGAGMPALLIVAHLDTVGAGDMREPFTPRVRNGRLYGRGAQDIKSGVAAMCAAAASVVRENLPLVRAFTIAAVVDEECDSLGTQELLKTFRAEAAVVLEPTDLKLVIAHKGFAWFEITTRGRAAHGSMPQEGRDAIRMMGRVLEALDRLDRKLAARAAHRWLGRASLHASLISGGQELSSYPAECTLQIERRTLPGETPAALEMELNAVLRELRAGDRNFRATLRRMAARPAYEIAPGEKIVQHAAAALREVTGRAEFSGMSPWTDTALLAEAGIPGVVLGPRGRGLHGANEYVEMKSVVTLAEVLRRLIVRMCARE